jgi:hypothetical protein
MDLRVIGWGGKDWIHLAQDRDQWRISVDVVPNLLVPWNGVNSRVARRLASSKERLNIYIVYAWNGAYLTRDIFRHLALDSVCKRINKALVTYSYSDIKTVGRTNCLIVGPSSVILPAVCTWQKLTYSHDLQLILPVHKYKLAAAFRNDCRIAIAASVLTWTPIIAPSSPSEELDCVCI